MEKVLREGYVNALDLFYTYKPEIKLPLDPNPSENQKIFKDFYQNMVEESSEFLELYFELTIKERKDHPEAILDEVADVTNFVHVMMGLFLEDFPNFEFNPEIENVNIENSLSYTEISHYSASFIVANMVYRFGMVCNLLKNRPWKGTQFLVKKSDLKQKLDNAYLSYKIFLASLQLEQGELQDALNRKIRTNKFRIKSNY